MLLPYPFLSFAKRLKFRLFAVQLLGCGVVFLALAACSVSRPVAAGGGRVPPPLEVSSTTAAGKEEPEALFVSLERPFLPEFYATFAPEVRPDRFLLTYDCFLIAFDSLSRNAKWVQYLLTRERLGDGVERKGNFRMEPRIRELSPRDTDYRGTGFDRGHLAPAADMSHAEQCMYESFFLTNVSPQVPAFNRGVWKRLEDWVRTTTVEKDSIWVLTGPVLGLGAARLGASELVIPEAFFKVLYRPDAAGGQGLAFILPNAAGTGDLRQFARPIREVEALTGLNFFPVFSPALSARVEEEVDWRYWFGTP
ncbi:MAG: DNA/RNA non-specific endonuclease [Nitritalea sp.]